MMMMIQHGSVYNVIGMCIDACGTDHVASYVRRTASVLYINCISHGSGICAVTRLTSLSNHTSDAVLMK